MSTTVEKDIVVDVPVRTVYDQWTQFEEFPRFMGGVQQVTQLADDRLEWVAEIGGVRRQWVARILEQTPDRKVAWAATEGATNAGAVTFQDLCDGRTSVRLELEYEPEGFVEQVGDKLNVVENQAEKDLERFKEFIESEGRATGSWRGSVGEGTTVGTEFWVAQQVFALDHLQQDGIRSRDLSFAVDPSTIDGWRLAKSGVFIEDILA